MSDKEQNGWNEYSRLVLKELETLSDGIDGLNQEIQTVKQEIAKMQVIKTHLLFLEKNIKKVKIFLI